MKDMIYEKDIKTDREVGYNEILQKCKIDTSVIIEKPSTILSLYEVYSINGNAKRVFTLGNFSVIIGKWKGKKTFLQILFSSALLKGTDDSNKLKGELPDGKNKILYIDTEQGLWDSANCIRKIERMSGMRDNLMAFNLRAFEPMERCNMIESLFKIHGAEIGYCVIDGIADLAFAINDEEEATRIVSMLLRLTATYNCHISTIIHQNKNDNFATGHLGSAIMKKAEIVISVNKIKDDKDCSKVQCDYGRGQMFEPFILRINHYGLPEIEEIFKEKIVKNYYDVKDKDEPDLPF